MEGIEPQILETLFMYREAKIKEEEEEAREMTIDFKKDTLDPSREIV